jgi:hypothetical protein
VSNEGIRTRDLGYDEKITESQVRLFAKKSWLLCKTFKMVMSGSGSTPRDNGKLCISRPASPFERTIKEEGAQSRDSCMAWSNTCVGPTSVVGATSSAVRKG